MYDLTLTNWYSKSLSFCNWIVPILLWTQLPAEGFTA